MGRNKVNKGHTESVKILTFSEICSDLKSNLVVVQVRHRNGKANLEALVDTGADRSVMLYEEWVKIYPKPLLEASHVQLCSVANEKLSIVGEAQVPLSFNGVTVSVNVVIIRKLRQKIILGMTFFSKYQAVIDLATSSLIIQPTYTVYALAPIVVPPFSEVTQLACVNLPPGVEGTFKLNSQTSRRGLMGAKVLASVRAGRIPVRLMNPSHQPIQINRRARIGLFEILSSETEITSIEAPSRKKVKFTTEKPKVDIDLSRTNLENEQKQRLQTLVDQYSEVFVNTSDQLGHTQIV